ncbi:MAG: SdpI family protein [Clostridiales bacterium]|jgi:uncharacterized membrane protein|nr:SdpI family protein [Clostridiales bacterium]
MKNRKIFIFCIAIALAQLVAAAILYRYLPDLIPSHWDAAGNINGFSATWTLFIFPAFTLLFTLLIQALPKIDPKGKNVEKSALLPITQVSVAVLMTIVMAIVLAASFGISMPVNVIIPLIIGLMFVLMGSYMPKVKQNYSVGLRLPWTLASENVWVKTHKFGGYVFVISGVVFILGALIPAPLNFILPLSVMTAGLIVTAVYSYREFKKETSAERDKSV